MMVVLVGICLAPALGAVWCWATSDTYREQRRQWIAARRQAAADRRYARTHRISA